MDVQFNLRYSTELSSDDIMRRIHSTLDSYGLNYELNWTLNGDPFLTDKGALLDAVVAAVEDVNHKTPELLTTGGTSDGRFIARMGGEVIELGPVNATIHKVNECVNIAELEKLTDMYQKTLEKLLAK
jgi:succinyl-diaminopimelate desuccinylase